MSLDATIAFFDLIHAAEGWRCLFTLPDRKHHWVRTSSQLATKSLALDAQGFAVFHTCATFAKRRRSQENVQRLRCLWFDIDAGLGKPYPTARDAFGALEKWRLAVGLPPCIFIVSGGGIHTYWPLRDSLDRAAWEYASSRLRALAQAHGLAIDAGSTIDAARILRPPGTHNRKLFDAAGKKIADVGGEPREVKLGPLVGPYSRDDLKVLFEGGENALPEMRLGDTFRNTVPLQRGISLADDGLTNSSGEKNGSEPLLVLPRSEPPTSDLSRISSVSGARAAGSSRPYLRGNSEDDGLTNIQAAEPDPDVDAIVRECAQVRRLRDRAGQIPEPEWYSVLGVLAHCGETGRGQAHQWSSGDSRYNAPDTDAKLVQARKAAGPTTCRRFADLNPQGCGSCQYAGRITSPIQLGRNLPAASVAPLPVAVDGTLALPQVPDPYFWSGSRLAVRDLSGKDGAPPYRIIADYPFTITELQEAERTGGVSAVCRSWEPMKKEWREFPLQLKDAIGDRGAGALAHHSVAIDKRRWDYMRSFITDMANHHKGTRAYGIRYEQFGWKAGPEGPSFVIGLEKLGRAEPSVRIFGSAEVERRAKQLQPHGNLAAWTQAAQGGVGRPGMEAHAFIAICGFASVLHRFTGAMGGTIVHAMTLETGKGKSFALDLAASSWGETPGMRLKDRDTPVAKFIAIGTCGHLPVIYDELRARGPDAAEIMKEFILHYTLGEDKARGAPEGGLRDDALPWSNLLLSAANISLVDTCLSDGGETAQAARVFEFSLTLPEGVKTSDGAALEKTIQENRGTAGRAFVQAVLERYSWVEQAVPQAIRMWEQRLGAGPEMRFTLRLLGCVSVAMTLLQQTGILRLDSQAVTRWIDHTARENMARLAVEKTPDPAGILSQMMGDLLPETLVMPGPVPRGTAKDARYEALREPRGKLWARQEIHGREYIVNIIAVKQWMQEHHYPMTEIGRKLKELGVVTDLRIRRTLGAGWRRVGGQPWCWRVDGNHPSIAELWVETDLVVTETPSNVIGFPGVAK